MSIYKDNVEVLTDEDRINKVKDEIKNIIENFLNYLINTQEFELNQLLMILLSTIVLDQQEPIDGLPKFISDDFDIYKEKFFDAKEDLLPDLRLRLTVDKYQGFEQFIHNIISLLYYAFPKFLIKDEDTGRIGTYYHNDIYGITSIFELRKSLTHRKAKEILQAKNILDVLSQIEKTFGIDLNLDTNDKNGLIKMSLLRNNIVHNQSVVNDTFIFMMSKHNLDHDYDIGERIEISKGESKTQFENLKEISKKISIQIFEHIEHIMQYHNAK